MKVPLSRDYSDVQLNLISPSHGQFASNEATSLFHHPLHLLAPNLNSKQSFITIPMILRRKQNIICNTETLLDSFRFTLKLQAFLFFSITRFLNINYSLIS